jgi:hypothetical protein
MLCLEAISCMLAPILVLTWLSMVVNKSSVKQLFTGDIEIEYFFTILVSYLQLLYQKILFSYLVIETVGLH